MKMRSLVTFSSTLLGLPSLWAQEPPRPQPPIVPETRIEAERPRPPAPPPPPPTPAEAPFLPPEFTPPAPTDVFSSPPTSGYRADSATTGTKFDLPLVNYPGSLSVVGRDLLNDQLIFRTDELLRNVPSATKVSDFRRPDAFNLRGFELRSRDFRKDGFLDPTPAPRDLANIERIEVMSGPASVLYGAGQPSGVVNFITKRALPDAFAEGTITAGSYGFFRTTADVNSPVAGSDRLFFRVNVAYETMDGFRDYAFGERFFIAPTFTWLIDDQTNVQFSFEYLNDRRRFDTGVVALGGQVGLLPINTFLGQPDDRQLFQDYRFSVFLNHKIDCDWTARIGLYTQFHDTTMLGTVPLSTGTPFGLPGDLLFRQRQALDPFREQYYSMIADLAGKVDLMGVTHRLVLGTELGSFQSRDFTGSFSEFAALQPLPFPPFFFVAPTSPVFAFNPDLTRGLPQPPLGAGQFTADFIQNRYGFYAQDLIEVSKPLKVLAGVRYDIIDQTLDREFIPVLFTPGFAQTRTQENYYRLTPRVGAVYQPFEEPLSFYGTYSQSFEPPPGGPYRNPEPLQPETGELFEVGFKADLLDRQLSLTVAAFHLEKQNVFVQDDLLFATQVGAQRSQGLETSVAGRLTERWSVTANYSYIDSRILADNDPRLVGQRFRGIPYNQSSVWSRYNVVQDECRTLGLAAGMILVGDRTGDLQASFRLPGYVRWDAGLFYERSQFHLSVYVENVFDREYYVGSVNNLAVFPGMPLNVRAQAGWRF